MPDVETVRPRRPRRVMVEKNVAVPLRDGIETYGDLYRPLAIGPVPTVISRTAYNKEVAGEGGDGGLSALKMAERGYSVLVVDTRGRASSEGEFRPFETEGPDGYDTVEWAAAQPWCDGNVALYGGSYVGATALLAARERPPSLRCVIANVTADDYYDGWVFSGGAFQLGFAATWSMTLASTSIALRSDYARRVGSEEREGLVRTMSRGLDPLWTRPLSELPSISAADVAPWWATWLEHDRRDGYWVLSDRRARWGSLGLAIARSCPVTCPHCRSRATSRRLRRTELGYRRFQCRTCRRRFNERTGTRFNEIRFPSDVVMLAVLWRLRYKLSLRDVAEMLLERGYQVTHETVRTWEASFAPLLSERLRAKRRGRIGSSWYIDETYVKVAGRWCYLYRAIDGDGQLIDSMLSEHRDKHAARRFFRGLVDVAEARPLRVTTDRHPAYPRAVRWILGRKVVHRTTQYLNNFMEQDHRGVKQRYYPMRGFGSFVSAARFCTAFDELREYFRSRSRRGQHVSLAEQRRLFAVRWRSLIAEMSAA